MVRSVPSVRDARSRAVSDRARMRLASEATRSRSVRIGRRDDPRTGPGHHHAADAPRARPPRGDGADRAAALGSHPRRRPVGGGPGAGRRAGRCAWRVSRSTSCTPARSSAPPRPPRPSPHHHGLPVLRLDGVLEADYGEWTGQKISDLAKTDLWKVVQRTPSRVTFPAGEAMAAMQTRMVAALEAVVADHPGQLVVVVSHADPIKAAIAHYTGVHLDLFQRIVVSPASVTAFAFGAPRRGHVQVQRHRQPRRPEATDARAGRRDRCRRRGGERRTRILGGRRCLSRSSSTWSTDSAPVPSASRASGPSTCRRAPRPPSSPCCSRRSRSRCSRPRRSRSSTASRSEYPEDPIALPAAVAELREPTVPLFRARLIGLGFDPERELVLIELRERARRRRRRRRRPRRAGPADRRATPTTDAARSSTLRADDDEEGYVARIYATRSQVRAMAAHGAVVVSAGRPPCDLCGQPMDPAGHRCPRWN